MALLVDTNVWSPLLRRDAPANIAEVDHLHAALAGHTDAVITTGIVVQELLRGFVPLRAQQAILERFEPLTRVQPSWDDHVRQRHSPTPAEHTVSSSPLSTH